MSATDTRVHAISPVGAVLRRWVCIGLAVASVASVLGYYGSQHWLLDLLSNFRVYYCAYGIVSALALVLLRSTAWSTLALALALSNAWGIAPFYVSSGAKRTPGAPTLRLTHFNVELWNTHNAPDIARHLEQAPSDVVLLVEVSGEWMTELVPRMPSYQLVSDLTPVAHNPYFGSALFVRKSSQHVQIDDAGPLFLEPTRKHPSLGAHLRFDGRALALLGVHHHPPISSIHARIRHEHFKGSVEWLRAQANPLVMIGDFNASPWSADYRLLFGHLPLRDAQLGFGLSATWLPFGGQWIGLPIDRCVHSSELSAVGFSLGPSFGSDHRPVHVTLQWSAR